MENELKNKIREFVIIIMLLFCYIYLTNFLIKEFNYFQGLTLGLVILFLHFIIISDKFEYMH